MEQFDFPPFELNKYRIIYMETTESIVKCTVELNLEHSGQLADGIIAFEKHKAQVSELVLRLLLMEEAYGRTNIALPDTFTVKHQDYLLSTDVQPWTTPLRFRFFRRYVDQDPGTAYDAAQPHRFITHQRLVCWPFKYTFTFTPRLLTAVVSDAIDAHNIQNERMIQVENEDGVGDEMQCQHERSQSIGV